MKPKHPVTLVLFNQALRLTDNPLLQTAAGQHYIALLSLDPAQWHSRTHGLQRAHQRRWHQQITAHEVFRQSLAKLGIPCICVVGETFEIVQQLQQRTGAHTLRMVEPVGTEEQTQLEKLQKLPLQIITHDLNSLLQGLALRPDVTHLPTTFTQFRQQREPLHQLGIVLSTDLPEDADDNSLTWLSCPWPAAEQSWQQCVEESQMALPFFAANEPLFQDAATAEAHFTQYLKSQHILHYKQTRNALEGMQNSSFLSQPLSLGLLSVRWVWRQICQFEQQFHANESTYWLKFELLWREYFRWHVRKYGARCFIKAGLGLHPIPQLHISKKKQRAAFERWCQGNTGVPIVDANMRYLVSKGLLSNRGRQLVASYLIFDLQLDWRWGASFFEQQLLDYDVASNWGNWAYIAGAGTQSARWFNQLKQALLYDPEAIFVQRWLPERRVKGVAAHLPYAPAAGVPAPYLAAWQDSIDHIVKLTASANKYT